MQSEGRDVCKSREDQAKMCCGQSSRVFVNHEVMWYLSLQYHDIPIKQQSDQILCFVITYTLGNWYHSNMIFFIFMRELFTTIQPEMQTVDTLVMFISH